MGVDAAKAKHAIAIAEGGRNGEVRYYGEMNTTPAAVERFVRKLEKKHPYLHFCYEAGPKGYGLYRQLIGLGHRCDVVAPSLIPMRPGERVKTNRRDAVNLARLLRAGDRPASGSLTQCMKPPAIWCGCARLRAKTCARSVSSYCHSCFAMVEHLEFPTILCGWTLQSNARFLDRDSPGRITEMR